jgi:uroporphyrinogen-III synthase
VVFGECYRRINPQKNADVLAQAHAGNQLQAIIITSSEALRFLLDVAGESDWLKAVPLFVNHDRIAEQAQSHGLKVISAGQPGDEAMLQLLTKHFQT